jgi:hypothetical protein
MVSTPAAHLRAERVSLNQPPDVCKRMWHQVGMKLVPWVLVLVACSSKASPPPAEGSAGSAGPAVARPPDDMDEKMRHCPLAIDGATATLSDTADGVRWDVTAASPEGVVEVRKRAHHVVEFAAGRAAKGQHGGGQGGGTMRNCPVVTSGVVIAATDLDSGARLEVRPVRAEDAVQLRTDSHERAAKFPFVGATIADTAR